VSICISTSRVWKLQVCLAKPRYKHPHNNKVIEVISALHSDLTRCSKKSNPLKLFAVFSATTCNFSVKFLHVCRVAEEEGGDISHTCQSRSAPCLPRLLPHSAVAEPCFITPNPDRAFAIKLSAHCSPKWLLSGYSLIISDRDIFLAIWLRSADDRNEVNALSYSLVPSPGYDNDLLLLLFFLPTSTKPWAWKLSEMLNNGCNNFLFCSQCVEEGGHIPPLQS